MEIQRPWLVACAVLAAAGCATDDSPVPEETPFPDDAFTVSATRPITDVERTTVSFEELGVTVSNDFDGGRFSGVSADGDSVLVLRQAPENAPINNSAWYAFKAWAPTEGLLRVRLSYEEGEHRYVPKIRTAGGAEWTPLDTAALHVDDSLATATFDVPVGPDTVYVAGQEVLPSPFFEEWTRTLVEADGVSRREFGTSARGRPLWMMEAGNPDAARHILLIGRQHPPEVTGSLAMVTFVEEVLGGSELARAFRDGFRIHVVPVMNPDGVDLGHWRHNTGGVDLNRDWVAFHQPETSAVRDEMAEVLSTDGSELWFFVDFHSTDRDVFFTLDRALETWPADVLDPWVDHIRTSLPEYAVEDAPSSSGGYGVVSRDWAWREYRTPGMVYEVGDETPRALIRDVAEAGARGTMQILLDRAAGMDGG